jgi:hypothetical protein
VPERKAYVEEMPNFIGLLDVRALAIPGRLELPTYGLGNRRSIRLSYGTEAPAGEAGGLEFPYQSGRRIASLRIAPAPQPEPVEREIMPCYE